MKDHDTIDLIIRLLEAATFMAGVPMLRQHEHSSYIADDGNNIFLHIFIKPDDTCDISVRVREGYGHMSHIQEKRKLIEGLVEQITADGLPFGNRWEHATRSTALNYDRKRFKTPRPC